MNADDRIDKLEAELHELKRALLMIPPEKTEPEPVCGRHGCDERPQANGLCADHLAAAERREQRVQAALEDHVRDRLEGGPERRAQEAVQEWRAGSARVARRHYGSPKDAA